MEDTLRVGVISSTHGVRGEVKVYPTTDDVNRFKKLKTVILDTGRDQITLSIESVKFFKNMVILKFKEFNNINEIEKYKGKDLLIRRDQAVKLAPNENFITDLIGLKVVTDEGKEFGTLTDVLQTGANDVYVIESLEGKEYLFPAIPQCILDVNLESQMVTVHILMAFWTCNTLKSGESKSMNYHILTLFPEMVLDGLNTSIIGRAAGKGLLSIEAVNIRDYTKEKHGHVDDTPYGGGAGMVMQAAPVCDAYEALCERIGKRPRVLYMTPQGQTFNQKIAEELAQEEDLVFLCGHYEGIDERALELIVTDYLSVGDYVLTGGELPAMVMIDCISRLVPGVLNNDVSAEIESFHDNLLEYPQYTRPEVYQGMRVPEVLLSGHHKNIETWRRQQSIRRTLERRPDLLEEANLSKKERQYLAELMAEKEAQEK